jgi:uncharacterized protein (TIGR02246 family)
MDDDERTIRELVQAWMDLTRSGDFEAVLDLMTDDVIFMTPGREPFGKQEFREHSQQSAGVRIDANNDIQEIHVAGEWGWMRSRLAMTVTPPNGEPVERSGYALTILRKGGDGRWRVTRDANLVS